MNLPADDQQKESLREPLSEKNLTYTNTNNGSADLAFALNTNKLYETENELTTNVTGLITVLV